MRRIAIMMLVIVGVVLLSSCEVEFSPNAEWREVPSIYCVLDQDDSVSSVRVQKCYLGEGNLKEYAAIYDSINYAEGYLDVRIMAWRSEAEMLSGTAEPVHTMLFDYQLLSDKEDGTFAAPQQPIYSHKNQQGELDTGLVYQLVVSEAATDRRLAQAVTRLVGDASSLPWLTAPNPAYGTLGFYRNGSCSFEWRTFARGRRYQASVRFFFSRRYQDPGQVDSVDMPLSVVSGSLRESDLATSMSQGAFMVNMEQALRGDTSTKDYVDSALVMLAVCNESLHAYLNSIAMMQSAADQDHVAYSNIEGGVGIFASRRAHLVQAVKTDQSDIAPYGLHYLLESLDVGFGR